MLAAPHAPSRAQDMRQADKPLSIVTFGTSLTARANWPERLEEALRACMHKEVLVVKVAKSGATSEWGMNQIERVDSANPDIILIEFYANDAALHRGVSLATSKANVARLIDDLRAKRPQAQILPMVMNPMHGVRKLIRPFLARYIDAHLEVAREKGLKYLDHRPRWEALSDRQRVAAIPDGVHPVADAAAKIMMPALLAHIAGQNCKQYANQSRPADFGGTE